MVKHAEAVIVTRHELDTRFHRLGQHAGHVIEILRDEEFSPWQTRVDLALPTHVEAGQHKTVVVQEGLDAGVVHAVGMIDDADARFDAVQHLVSAADMGAGAGAVGVGHLDRGAQLFG